jgi:hypothetical protein
MDSRSLRRSESSAWVASASIVGCNAEKREFSKRSNKTRQDRVPRWAGPCRQPSPVWWIRVTFRRIESIAPAPSVWGEFRRSLHDRVDPIRRAVAKCGARRMGHIQPRRLVQITATPRRDRNGAARKVRGSPLCPNRTRKSGHVTKGFANTKRYGIHFETMSNRRRLSTRVPPHASVSSNGQPIKSNVN